MCECNKVVISRDQWENLIAGMAAGIKHIRHANGAEQILFNNGVRIVTDKRTV